MYDIKKVEELAEVFDSSLTSFPERLVATLEINFVANRTADDDLRDLCEEVLTNPGSVSLNEFLLALAGVVYRLLIVGSACVALYFVYHLILSWLIGG
ncbi:MAG: hypothetical protein WDZ85_01625 [Candidatus Paceibacterota bacterium]